MKVNVRALYDVITSRSHRIVGVVGDPLQFRGGGEGVGNVSKVLQLLNIKNIEFLAIFSTGE